MTKEQRLILIIAILASFVAFLDGSVVNVALPAIVRNLGGGLAVQQWVVDAYLITLGSLILLAGSLSDLFGRKRILNFGLIGFGVTSLLCAAAPTSSFLIVSRALQGIAGALLVPSSLAMIISAFKGAAQGKAIGSWTAWTGIAFVIGPLLGGMFVDVASWRLVFAINLLPIAVTLWLLRRVIVAPENSKRPEVDSLGAVLGAIGLGGPVYSLIEQAHYGWRSPLIYAPLLVGLSCLTAFIWHESRSARAMLPLALFTVRNFSVGNVATFAIYGGLSVATFLITIFVQQVGGYSAIMAGLALLPVTIIMFLLSPRFGSLAGRFGARWFMTFGPIIGAAGFVSLLRVGSHIHYWLGLLPGVLLFGLGLSITVAPLTSAILGAISSRQAGVGSAVNNAVARVAGLIAIALLGLVLGHYGLDVASFHRGIIFAAGLLLTGGVVSAIGITNKVNLETRSDVPAQ